jgi:hypothetical protein
MNTSTLTYAAIGAIAFATLSAIAARYREEPAFELKTLGRDAIAGAIITAFLLTLVPDIFPQISVFSGGLAAVASVIPKVISSSSSSSGSDSDFELQVGYPSKRR